MSEITEAIDDVIDILEDRFLLSDDREEKVLKTLIFATANALLATKNEECEITYNDCKMKFSIEILTQ